MQEKSADVKSKGASVGTATFPEYDATTEAVVAQGEATILAIINKQIKTDAMNAVRSDATGKPSGKALQMKAFQEILATTDPAVLAELAADEVKMNEAMNVLIARYKAEAEGTTQEQAQAEDEDEDLEDIE